MERCGSIVGSSASALNGRERALRVTRVLATLTALQKIQVFRGRATLEALDAAQHAERGLLDDFFGDGAASDVARR
jgi:hypothetical protein